MIKREKEKMTRLRNEMVETKGRQCEESKLKEEMLIERRARIFFDSSLRLIWKRTNASTLGINRTNARCPTAKRVLRR